MPTPENDAGYRDELDDHIAESMRDPEYAAAPTPTLDQIGDPDDVDEAEFLGIPAPVAVETAQERLEQVSPPTEWHTATHRDSDNLFRHDGPLYGCAECSVFPPGQENK